MMRVHFHKNGSLPALSAQRGTSLVEVVVGSLIASVLVAGLMAAFLTALRISSVGGGNVEASSLVQQTLERFRNRVACDDAWFNPVTCFASSLPPANSSDPLSAGAMFGGTRTYTITQANCGTGLGDCFKVVAKVSWTPPQ